MSQFERVYLIDRMLRRRIKPDKHQLLKELEVSEPTLKRDIQYMRDRLQAPIVFNRDGGYYEYSGENVEFSLPGLWFSADEVHALLLIIRIIDQIQPSFLRDQLRPFEDRLRSMANVPLAGCDSITKRIEMLTSQSRIVNPESLDTLVKATLWRKRLELDYYSRGRRAETVREVSPLRLLYYREGWFLDAWCHSKNASRRFAVDAIRAVKILDKEASDIDLTPPGEGYGIFSGSAVHTAVLLFHASVAPWIRTSQWHPEQQLEEQDGGRILLRVPYSEPTELLMDILRYGANVEVLDPLPLRQLVAQALERAVSVYRQQERRTPVRAAEARAQAATG